MLKSKLIPMNLQLFAEGDSEPKIYSDPMERMQMVQALMNGQGEQTPPVVNEPQPQAQPTTPTEGQQQEPQNPVNPTPNADNGQGVQQAPPNNQPTEEQLIAGKFKSVDDLAKSYANLESFNTQTRQELSQIKQQNQELMAKIQQMQQQPPQTTVPTGEEEPSNEELMNKFYENPREVIRQEAERLLAERESAQQAEIQKQQQAAADWGNRVDAFTQSIPDFQSVEPHMVKFFSENPDLKMHPNGLQIAYNAVKWQMTPQYNAPTEYLKDEAFLKDNILNNPQIKDKIIQDYLASIKKNEQPPVVIGNQPSSAGTTMTPPAMPQNMDEARMMVRRMFEQ